MKRGNFWMNRVTQPIAALAVLILARTRITPNAVTVLSAVMLIAAAGLVSVMRAAPWTGLVLAVASQLSYALDGADGALARVRGCSSRFGAWFDLMFDRIAHVSVLSLLALAVLEDGAYRADSVKAVAPVMLLMVVSVAYHNGFNLRGALFPARPASGGEASASPGSRAGVFQAILLTVCDFGFFMFSLSVGVAFGRLLIAVWFGIVVHAVGLAALSARVRQLSAEAALASGNGE